MNKRSGSQCSPRRTGKNIKARTEQPHEHWKRKCYASEIVHLLVTSYTMLQMQLRGLGGVTFDVKVFIRDQNRVLKDPDCGEYVTVGPCVIYASGQFVGINDTKSTV
jgi:hypothetical protein